MPDNELHEDEFQGKLTGGTVLRILAQTRPHWQLLVGFLGFIVLCSIMSATGTYVMKTLIDEGIMTKDVNVLLDKVFLYALVMSVDAGGVYGFIYCAALLGEQLKYDLRKKLFAHLQKLSFSYFDRTPAGWILSRMTSDINRISELATWMLLDLVWGITNITTSLIFMMLISWRLGLIAMIIVPALVILAITFRKQMIREYRKVRSINSKITGSFSENISGVRIVKALTREKKNLGKFKETTEDMYKASFRAAWLSAIFLPLVQLVSGITVGGILWFGGAQWQLGGISIGGIKAFISYITFMLWPVLDLSRVYAEMQQSIASAERVFSLMDTEPDILDQEEASSKAEFTGEIEFRKVNFAYKPDNPVLSDFSIRIRPGETLAIVGPTGGGKTTLVNLVSRFYEPTEGKILIDGQDYRSYTQRALQSRIGVVLQHPHLFSGTIEENLKYGNPDADREILLEAVEKAHALQMIEGLPRGFEEKVGEDGDLLSMGQKQLISIARTILADPDIIIMDEATSSIDTLTEQHIQEGMEELLHSRTSLVIAHRLSTIKNADRIIVIEQGQIRECGTHRELLAQKGHYYELYTNQFRQEQTSRIGALA